LETLMSRKSPSDPVPSLIAEETDSSTQLLTTRFSSGSPLLVLGQMQSSPATISQFEMKTSLHEVGSMPSVLVRKKLLRIETRSKKTRSQRDIETAYQSL